MTTKKEIIPPAKDKKEEKTIDERQNGISEPTKTRSEVPQKDASNYSEEHSISIDS